MKKMFASLATMAALLATAVEADAAVIGTYDFDYTTGGNGDPQGRNQNGAGVLITDNGTTFRDTFNFSDLAGATIDSFSLTLTFSGAGPTSLFIFPIENWRIIFEGADPSGTADDLVGTLSDAASPGTYTIASGDFPTVSFFDDAVAALSFDFSFDQTGFGVNNAFRLTSASLSVDGTAASTIGGTAVVPLPAPGLLLLAALGGLGLMRRRSAPVPRDGINTLGST